MSVDDLVDVSSLIFGAGGVVRLYFGFRPLSAGVTGWDVGANKAFHFVLALCAAAAMASLCTKFGVLTARAGEEPKKSSSSPSDGGRE
jgi:hypothetical protein